MIPINELIIAGKEEKYRKFWMHWLEEEFPNKLYLKFKDKAQYPDSLPIEIEFCYN